MNNYIKISYDSIEDESDFDSAPYPIFKLNGQLFNGIVFEEHKTGYLEFSVVDGIKNGRFFSIYPNGKKRDEGICKNNYEIECSEWSVDGLLIRRLDDKFEKIWSNEGVLIKEIDFTNWTSKHFYSTGELQKDAKGEAWNKGFRKNIALNEEHYFAKNGDLLLKRYSEKSAPIGAIKKAYWYFIFEHDILTKQFEDILNSELVDIENDAFVNISIWLEVVLETNRAKGLVFLNHMLKHSNLWVKKKGLTIADHCSTIELSRTLEQLFNIDEHPPEGKYIESAWTIGTYAKKVAKRIQDKLKTLT